MTQWHPMHSARELEPGVWQLAITSGRPGGPGYAVHPFAEVRFLRLGDEQGYRTVIWQDDGPRILAGYFRTLRAACFAAHETKGRLFGPGGGINGTTGKPGDELRASAAPGRTKAPPATQPKG